MKLAIIAIGKRHDPAIAAAITDYTQRLARKWPLTWRILPPPQADLSPAEQKQREAVALLAVLKPSDTVIVLDERGQQWNSLQLSAKLEAWQHTPDRVVFVIGGAHGVSAAVLARANAVWSLSPLTFPHQLVRLILAEQLYRAQTIARGEPYHHA